MLTNSTLCLHYATQKNLAKTHDQGTRNSSNNTLLMRNTPYDIVMSSITSRTRKWHMKVSSKMMARAGCVFRSGSLNRGSKMT